jgi:hypothetical protein
MPSFNTIVEKAANDLAMAIINAVKDATLQDLIALGGASRPGPKPGRKRGRPRKAKPGRKPGRPPKAKPGRKPGRPRKVVAEPKKKAVAKKTKKKATKKAKAPRKPVSKE